MRPFIALVLICFLAHLGTAQEEENNDVSAEDAKDAAEEDAADDEESAESEEKEQTNGDDGEEKAKDVGNEETADDGESDEEAAATEDESKDGDDGDKIDEDARAGSVNAATDDQDSGQNGASLLQYLSKANTAMQSIDTRLTSAESRYNKKLWVLDAGLKQLKAQLTNYVLPTGCETVQKQNMDTWDEIGGIATVYSATMVGNLKLYCDMKTEGGGWTVFQRRLDGSVNFYRDWKDYTYGFGDKKGEFWLGLMNIHQLTKRGNYELRIEMTDWDDNMVYANYGTFSVGNGKGKYVLTVDDYSGDAGDSLSPHTGMKFTTKDDDNDLDDGNCAAKSNGGFWYTKCHQANPNGLYVQGGGKTPWGRGINWKKYKGYEYSLKTFEMKFRQKD